MFDMPSPEIREQKLKFIEILLIVGGIIGGSRAYIEGMNIDLGMFLLGSLLYYFMVSNAEKYSKGVYRIAFVMVTALTSFTFSGLAILPFIFNGIPILYAIEVFGLWLVLGILISVILAPKPPRATG